MTYEAKTNWKYDDLVTEGDMNRIEHGIQDVSNTLDTHLADYTQEVINDSKQSVTLPHGLSVLNASRAAQLKPKFKGRQLVNLLGRIGNFENDSNGDGVADGWSADWTYSVGVTKSLSNNAKYGLKAQRISQDGTNANNNNYRVKTSITLQSGKYYLILAEFYSTTIGKAGLVIDTGTLKGTTVASQWETKYLKVIGDDMIHNILLYGSYNDANIAMTTDIDGARIYEITAEEYAKIDVDPEWTGKKLAGKFPYVDSFQCVQNPAVKVEGENLFNPLNYKGIIADDVKFIDFYPTKISIKNASSQAIAMYSFKLIPNQVYTLRVKKNFKEYGAADVYANNRETFLKGTGAGELVQFTTPAQFDTIDIFFYNNVNNIPEITFSDIMLVLGDKLPTEFKPHNPSHLYLQTPLYEDETLEEIDGNWVRTKKWEKRVLDGGYTVGIVTSPAPPSGCKKVYLNDVALLAKAYNKADICIKYDGTVLRTLETIDNTRQDEFYIASTKSAYITVANTDSGWGENYTPTADEIKAYFYGWRMFDGTTGQNYNGTGTKHWYKLAKPGDTGTNILPTTSYPEWRPYQLHYQLATPTTEVVPHEGQLTLHEGANQVEVFEGVVVRELVNPIYATADGRYYINAYAPSNPLKYRTLKILDIFKNNNTDKALWSVVLYTSNVVLGVEYASTKAVNFDPAAQYSVTYLALPEEFTAPLLSVDATYDSNIKSTVDTLVDELAKVTTDVTALEMALREKGLLRKTPICKVRNNVNQLIPTGATTKLTFDTIILDTDNIKNNGYEFVIKTPGIYLTTCNIEFQYSTAGARSLRFTVTDSSGSVDIADTSLPGSVGTSSARLNLSSVNYFKKGDIITVKAFQDSGSAINVMSQTNKSPELAIVKVGD